MRFYTATGWVIAFLCAALSSIAGIIYDARYDAIIVTDYPQELPCTLRRLIAMDRYYGWNRISCDETASVYKVSCNLVVGETDGSETYFQIGTPEAPQETLIMQGNVYVCPYYIEGQNKVKQWWYEPQKVNRLTLGSKTDRGIKAALKFACAPGKEYSLATGISPLAGKGKVCRGGQFFMYNSVLTALSEDKGFEIPSLSFRGDGFVMENSEIARVQGMMTYGLTEGWLIDYHISNSVFAHGGAALVSGKQRAEGCVFRDCGIAVQDYGSMNVTLTDCIFENNRINFLLCYPAKEQPRIVCVDCAIGKPAAGDNYLLRQKPEADEKLPEFISKRHIVVEVVDSAGKAVPGAAISLKPDQPGTALSEIKITTDKNGRTPGKGDKDALLLTEIIKKCVVDSREPEAREITYTVSVLALGKTVTLAGVKPDQSWKVIAAVMP